MSFSLPGFISFLNASPTAFHAASSIGDALSQAGFRPLLEKEAWTLNRGQGYFVSKGGSLIAAFKIPVQHPSGITVLASHTDSPGLKLKPLSESASHGIGQLHTEVYGSPFLPSWFDRDLILAGRIEVLDKKNQITSQLVTLEEMPSILPQLAVHLDRSISEKGLMVHKQDHLKAIYSLSGHEKSVESILQKKYGFEKILHRDLFLVPLQKASCLGLNQEMIASYRLDNLTSAYAMLTAFCETPCSHDRLQMAFFWDHEEIGSETHLGAASSFSSQLIERICLALSLTTEEIFQLKASSFCVSIDLAHGLHPNFQEKYDSINSPLLGKGVVLKSSANQKYASDARLSALVKQLAIAHNIPLQSFASRSDIPSGSTLGPILSAHLNLPTLDIGIPGWAMHSIREVISHEDEASLYFLLKVILERLHYV